MTDPVAVIASAMRADAEALRLISQNVANAQTPAYRREMQLVSSAYDAVASAGAGDASPLQLDSAIDLRPGTFQSTAEPLNLAIEGPAFFVVSTAFGERLTRRGDFQLDAQGRLVTGTGDPVLGTNGPIQLPAGRPVITADGTVRVGDTVVDRLRLVEVTGPAALLPSGDGLYALAEGEQPLETNAAQVRQGFLETSNVQSVDEMISLMETMRRFETAQRFIQGYDSMVDEAITTLGRV
jgi:flagellar basal-body rod protein FlgF